MSSSNPIFDIAPPQETVTINGTDHKVVGVPFRIVIQLIKENPEMMAMLWGGTLDVAALMAKGPETAAMIIASGFGDPDDMAARKKAGDFPLAVQVDLVRGIIKATIGGGAGPFVEKLTGIRKLIELEDEKPARTFRLKPAEKISPVPSESSIPISDSPTQKFGT